MDNIFERMMNEQILSTDDDTTDQLWPTDVQEFSTQYGSESSFTYSVNNLKFGAKRFPRYGDFTEAAVWRTYGPWWQKLRTKKYTNRTATHFRSQDYVDLVYPYAIWPSSVEIYETYHPGSVVRILACDTDPSDGYGSVDHVRWFVLWSGDPQTGLPAKSRIFHPRLNQCPFPTTIIRLEINQDHCGYYTEIDAVRLCGYKMQPKGYKKSLKDAFTDLNDQTPCNASNDTGSQSTRDRKQAICVECGGKECSESCVDCTGAVRDETDGVVTRYCSCCRSSRQAPPSTATNEPNADDSQFTNATTSQSKQDTQVISLERITLQIAELHIQTGLTDALSESDNSHFDLLPDEVIQYIISYLDLHTMAALASTCQLFHKHCYDPLQYLEVNVQPYWPQVTDEVLEHLAIRCRYIHSINLSWCGVYNHISPDGFASFMYNIRKDLRSLSLASCTFLTESCLDAIADNIPHLEELDIQSCLTIKEDGFQKLSSFTHLKILNLYRTNVPTEPLLQLIRNNPDLEDLNVGSCQLLNCDQVVKTLALHCKQLKILDLWRAVNLTPSGLQALVGNCSLLTQLDLGWCGGLRPLDAALKYMASNCKYLKKIFLTANRSVCDAHVIAFAENLHHLEQLDFLGTSGITDHAVKRLLEACPKLVFLDLSFCNIITDTAVQEWRIGYPHVNIKRSYQDNHDGADD